MEDDQEQRRKKQRMTMQKADGGDRYVDSHGVKLSGLGYRFKPSDHELVVYYLMPKQFNMYVTPNIIHVVQFYNFTPDQLSVMFEPREGIWYFFTIRNRKYPNGNRPDRKAGSVGEGYWRLNQVRKNVVHDKDTVAFKNSLAFHRGKAPTGVKTNWLMKEYTLTNAPTTDGTGKDDMKLEEWVLCKMYYKPDPKLSREHGKDTPGHVSAVESSNMQQLAEETEINDVLPLEFYDMNAYSNLQATGMPPFNVFDGPTFDQNTYADQMTYSQSPQNGISAAHQYEAPVFHFPPAQNYNRSYNLQAITGPSGPHFMSNPAAAIPPHFCFHPYPQSPRLQVPTQMNPPVQSDNMYLNPPGFAHYQNLDYGNPVVNESDIPGSSRTNVKAASPSASTAASSNDSGFYKRHFDPKNC